MEKLPSEILFLILNKLTKEDFINFALSAKKYVKLLLYERKSIVNYHIYRHNKSLWKNIIIEDSEIQIKQIFDKFYYDNISFFNRLLLKE